MRKSGTDEPAPKVVKKLKVFLKLYKSTTLFLPSPRTEYVTNYGIFSRKEKNSFPLLGRVVAFDDKLTVFCGMHHKLKVRKSTFRNIS